MKKHSGKKADLRKVQPLVAQIGGSEYGRLLTDIKDRVRAAQYEALRAVNKELVALYWDIGRLIVERQDEQKWGKAIVENLAADLQVEFPGLLASPHKISGICDNSTWNTRGRKDSNHWLEKSVGPSIWW